MAISYSCPHCGAQTQVDEKYAGHTGNCASCGQTITVPGSSTAGVAAPSSGKSSGKSSSAPVIIAVVAGSLVVMLFCGGILVALLLPAIQAAREAANRTVCMNNTKQIAAALLNYESAYGSFPPAFVADENGRPMHSWRVLILPFIEEEGLYSQYDFDKPWDSPENLALADFMPSVYMCPSNPGSDITLTSYLAITGPGTAFPGNRSTRMKDFLDGMHKSILVIEAADKGVNWLEPTDLDVSRMTFRPGSGPGDPSSSHSGGIVITGFADGHVDTIHDDVDPAVFQAMTTIAGND